MLYRILKLTQADDYLSEDGRALAFSDAGWPDLSGATVRLRFGAIISGVLAHVLTVQASVISPILVEVELTAEDTDELYLATVHAPGQEGQLRLQLIATLADGKAATLAHGHADLAAAIPEGASSGSILSDSTQTTVDRDTITVDAGTGSGGSSGSFTDSTQITTDDTALTADAS